MTTAPLDAIIETYPFPLITCLAFWLHFYLMLLDLPPASTVALCLLLEWQGIEEILDEALEDEIFGPHLLSVYSSPPHKCVWHFGN